MLVSLTISLSGCWCLPKLPTEWSSHKNVAENFASSYQDNVNKGKYTMNADGKVSVSTDDGVCLTMCYPAIYL